MVLNSQESECRCWFPVHSVRDFIGRNYWDNYLTNKGKTTNVKTCKR